VTCFERSFNQGHVPGVEARGAIGQLKLNFLQPAASTFVVHREPSWSRCGQQCGCRSCPLAEAREFPQHLPRITGGLDYVTSAGGSNRSTRHFSYLGVRLLEQLGNARRVCAQPLPKTQHCIVCFTSAAVRRNPLLNFAENVVVVWRDRVSGFGQALFKACYTLFRKDS
jgi:hypothetical protein